MSSPVGMRVPPGGSNCRKCEYLKDEAGQLCRNPDYIKWNGGPKFPFAANEYCCNYFDWSKSANLVKIS